MNFSEMDDSKKKLLLFGGIGLGVCILLILIVTVMALSNQQGTQTAQEPQSEVDTTSESGAGSSNGMSGAGQGKREDDAQADSESNEEKLTTDEARVRPGERPIAEVGEETLYYSDFIYYQQFYEDDEFTEEIQSDLIETMARESVILQAAYEDGIISELNEKVYNSTSKDHVLRKQLVEEIEERVFENKVSNYHGTFISIWYNNALAPVVPDEQIQENKSYAFQVISDLHERLQNNELTIEEAGEEIRANNALSEIDLTYRSNAIVEFHAEENNISGFDQLNTAVVNLEKGEISDIIDVSGGVEEFYAVVVLDDKETSSDSASSFEEWVTSKNTQYEKVIY